MNKMFALLCLPTALSGCMLAPEFELPDISLPATFKQEPADAAPAEEKKGEWSPIAPLEKEQRGEWWKAFGDEPLNALEAQAIAANPSLTAAAARVEQARATVRANASTLFPTIEIGGNAVRSKPSSAGVAAFGGNPNAELNPYTLYSANASASYEVDLFGRVRSNERALSLEADAQEAMYRSTLLALTADVAQHYFSLRALDAERALLKRTVEIRTEAARIMNRRFEVGEAGEQDKARTVSELATAEADLAALNRSRTVLENALAVLLGKMPSEFTFAEAPLDALPPQIPVGLPSSLLARRPDVSAAIARMAAANQRIGVARTAFFPKLILSAFGGYDATAASDLFSWSNRAWALGQLAGNALSMTIFDNGRNIARLDVADAAYEEAVANYRSQALTAFRDVEDALAAQRLLAEQSAKQDIAAEASTRTTELTQLRYDEGDADYFEVVDAQRNSLALNRAAINARGQRLIAAVALIRALGGGWDEPAPAAESSPAALPALTPQLDNSQE